MSKFVSIFLLVTLIVSTIPVLKTKHLSFPTKLTVLLSIAILYVLSLISIKEGL